MALNPGEVQRRVLSGDPAAFEPVVREFGPMVARICGSRIRGTLAEDAVQETFVRAWRGMGTYDPARDMQAWIAGIAYRAAVDIIRSEERHRTRESATGVSGASSGSESLGTQLPGPDQALPELLDLYRSLDRLGEEDRAAVTLHHLEELPVKDVAEALGWSQTKTATRLFRARARLRRSLEGDGR